LNHQEQENAMNWNLLARRRTDCHRRNSSPKRRIENSVEPLEPRIPPATLVGLTTTNLLVMFDSADPTKILNSSKIFGLAPGEDIVSMDSRPANGLIYGLTNKDTLYTLNPYNGRATLVGVGELPLVGKLVGIDFNPSVDRLRVVTEGDLNLRINPNTGGVVDGDAVTAGIQPDTSLAYDGADANTGKNPMVSAVAYDRNFQGATQTTLFGIDSTLNTLVRVGGVNGTPSPNLGTLFTVGALGVDPGKSVGFEIAGNGTAYASMQVKGKNALYTVDLGTGAATKVGAIGKGNMILDAMTTLPREEIVYGVTASNRLVSFRAANPGQLLSAVGMTNLAVGETIRDIDFRPATGELFGQTSLGRIVSVDTATGKVTQLGVPLVTSPQFSSAFPGDIDFNPTVDRLRLVNTNEDNLRFNPLTYTPVDSDANPANGNTPDTSLAFIATDPNVGANPNIVGMAYDRNDNDGATATTLWGIDSALNILVRQGAVDGNAGDVAGGSSPNGGLLTTIGSLNVDVTDQMGFDISGAGTLGNGAALAVMQVNGEVTSKLYSLNLTAGLTNQAQGSATLIGTVGAGEVVVAMAIAPQKIEFGAASVTVVEKAGAFAFIDVKRSGGSGGISTVRLDTFDGTALDGLDYTAVLGQIVTFNPGETLVRIQIPILADKIKEGQETIGLSLTSAGGGNTVLGNQINSLVIIKG
jgi:hypothetical protein